jgi:glucose/arabinose dehydrogenase
VLRRLLFDLFGIALFVLGMVACNGNEPLIATAATPKAISLTSPLPSLTFTATSLPPTVTPSLVPPSRTPKPILPSPTPTPVPPSATPTVEPPSDTPTLTPQPTATTAPSATPTVAASRPNDPASIGVKLQRVVGGLENPVGIANAGDGSGRLFVLEKVGRIRVVKNGAILPAPFLDISDRVGSSSSEQGLLGLAFHPHYADNGFFFVNYTDRQGNTVVARFSVSPDPGLADPNSESVLLTLDQPAANHNGGNLAFGPDGYLYIGTGDGGGAGDRYGNGQNGQTLLGAMLRLDVDGDQPYAIPPTNPFIGDPNVRDEIWAIGLRNPWRYSFDRLSGDLYIGDVGQNVYEEIDFQPIGSPGGQNYGWPIMEATHCYPESNACNRSGLTLPVAEYDHSLGCSVTGGYVYHGREFPLLDGIYLFGDYCSGRIWGLVSGAGDNWQSAQMAQAGIQISSFGEDEAGELYLLDMGQGELYKITAQPQ